MGDWAAVWKCSKMERRAFAYTALKFKGFEVNWETGAIERAK